MSLLFKLSRLLMLIKCLALSHVERWSKMALLVMSVFAFSVSRVLKLRNVLPIHEHEQPGHETL